MQIISQARLTIDTSHVAKLRTMCKEAQISFKLVEEDDGIALIMLNDKFHAPVTWPLWSLLEKFNTEVGML